MAIVPPRRSTLASLVFSVAFLLTTEPGARQGIKLNAPLIPSGDVLSLVTARRQALYLADQTQDGVDELFAVSLDAPFEVRQLNDSLVAAGDVSAFYFASPDATRVVYRADQQTNERFELFSAPIDGSAPAVKLNGALVSAGDVSTNFVISADSARVVYLADQDADEVFELFSVPIQGGTAVQLDGTLVLGGDVGVFELSPDSTRVIYVADQELNDRPELYSAPIDGSAAAIKLNPPLVFGGAVYGLTSAIAISPDSSRAVYRAEQDQDGVVELYSVPLDGSGTSVQLSGSLVAGGAVWSSWISPDSTRVAYVADQDTVGTYELYSARIDGSAPAVKLNHPMVPGGYIAPSFPQISPDSSHVVYVADQDIDDVHELYSVAIDGSGAPVKLHAPLSFGQGVSASMVRVSSDSARVVYIQYGGTPLVTELYSAPLLGGATPVKLNPALVTGGNVTGLMIDPHGRRVAYWADQLVDERIELFVVPIDGSAPARRVNEGLASSGSGPPAQVGFAVFAGDGNRIVYAAEQEQAGQMELFMTTLGPVARRAR